MPCRAVKQSNTIFLVEKQKKKKKKRKTGHDALGMLSVLNFCFCKSLESSPVSTIATLRLKPNHGEYSIL